jgi:folate-binding protein YgfZ
MTFLRSPATATLVITGSDRARWLNGMLTADLTKLSRGGVGFGLIVGKTGKVRAEVYVADTGEALLVAVPETLAEAIASELDKHLVMDDCEIVVSRDHAWLFTFCSAEVQALEAAARERGALAAAWVRRGTARCLVVVANGSVADDLSRGLVEAGAVRPTEEAWEAFRVQHFVAERGADFDDHYPQEASLELDAVSFQKGCYLGQEAVFMLQHRGHVKRRLVQLDLGGATVERGAKVLVAGVEVGEVSSVGGGFALAMVKYKHAFPGTELAVGSTRVVVTPVLGLAPEE